MKNKIFEVGDRVEFHKGGFGKVVRVGHFWCDVLWEDNEMRGNPGNSDVPGENYSISLPVEDMGKRFNPIIRKAKESRKATKNQNNFRNLKWWEKLLLPFLGKTYDSIDDGPDGRCVVTIRCYRGLYFIEGVVYG